jgi:DNA-binding beta-propeller fold protein YncE
LNNLKKINKKIALILTIMFFTLNCAPARTVIKEPVGELVWPPPPAVPRIKFVEQWTSRHDFGKPSQVLTFLIGPDPWEMLRRPQAVVADENGNIYVADSEQHIVFVFDKQKNTLRLLGYGVLSIPIGVAFDQKRGILYVSDSKLDKVFGLDKESGRVIHSFGGIGEFSNPSGMVFDDLTDRLYISDTKNHIIKVFDGNGTPLFTIGKKGREAGELYFPTYLAIDNQSLLYVMDTFNFRVQIFDSNGNFLKKFGKLGDASGQFNRPAGIGVDSEQHIYVVDTSFNNFQIFNSDGRLLLWIGNAGNTPGKFSLPTGLFIDKHDKIYVCDTFNRRIQVFQYLKEQN